MRHILVLGSGFAGLHTAQALAHEIADRRGLTLTVVTDQAHFLFTPLWSSVATGHARLAQVAIPVRSLLRDEVVVEVDTIEHIDLEARTARGRRNHYDYDYLVIATGAAVDWGEPENEHFALPCRSGRDAVDAEEAVSRAFEAAARAESAAERRQLLRFVVVGAGPAGVELAAHLASRLDGQRGTSVDADLAAQATIVLIEKRDEILADFPDELRAHALAHLRGAGVEVRVGDAVVRCSDRRVELASHDALGCGTIFWCGGVRTPGWLEAAGLPTDAEGRLRVESTLAVHGRHGVYVAGDLAGAPIGAPRTAEVAVQQAAAVARNITADLAGRSRWPWTWEPGGTFLSLGRTNAVAHVRGMTVAGRPAQALWGAMMARLLPQGMRSLALAPELFRATFAPRPPQGGGLLTD